MPDIKELVEYLPLVIPLVVVQFGLFGFSVGHILTHKTYKRGNRILWLIVSCINFIGPILYFVLGREDT